MASPKIETYTGKRVTVHSNKDFDAIVEKLYSSIGDPSRAGASKEIARTITSYSDESREAFRAGVEKTIGPHGFMIFEEFDHGAWVPLFGVGDGLKSKRVILGNPLIAITMLKHDLTAGLAVPVELLILEKKQNVGGGVDLIYQLPSALIAGLNDDKELVAAATTLDSKLAALVNFVAS